MNISFLLCGYNSRPSLVRRVLQSCLNQRQHAADFEVILVDSGSTPPLVVPDGLSQKVRLIREELPGLGRARARGILETQGEILVFVDDDTFLSLDYSEQAVRILRERPYLAAIGGQLLPEFEGPLPLPERFYRERLAIREFRGGHWSNRWDDFETSPIGGGMVVRRNVADEWARRFQNTPWRQGLGRSAKALSGGEDFDLLRIACEMGYGKGIFEELKLTHFVPKERLEPDFLVAVTEGNACSWAFYRGMIEPDMPIPPRTVAHRIRVWLDAIRKTGLDQHLFLAEQRGKWQGLGAVKRLREHSNN